MSRPAPRPLSFAIEGLTATLAPATTLAHVQQVWDRAVGAAIAEAGRPTAEHDGVLTVTCADSVWAAELDMMACELVVGLNERLGKDLVRKLRCRAG